MESPKKPQGIRGTLPFSPRPISPETSSLRQQAAQSPKTQQQRPELPEISLSDIAFTMEGTPTPRLSNNIPYGYAFCFTDEIPRLQIPQGNRPKSPLQKDRNHSAFTGPEVPRLQIPSVPAIHIGGQPLQIDRNHITTPVTFINGNENLSTVVRPQPQRPTAPQEQAKRQSPPPQVRQAWG